MLWVNPKTLNQIYFAKNTLDPVLPEKVPVSLVPISAASLL